MTKNSLGTDGPSEQSARANAGTSVGQDNVKANAQTQRDGTPTNAGVKPSNPGTHFFKQASDKSPKSGMEAALGKLADKTHKR